MADSSGAIRHRRVPGPASAQPGRGSASADAGSHPERQHVPHRPPASADPGATSRHPDAISPENEDSPLRWLTVNEARDLVGDNNLRRTLDRADALFAAFS
jgi:hypothetical protein